MDILNIFESICSIIGLAFAIYTYCMSRNEKRAVCCNRRLTVLGCMLVT